MTTMVMQLKWWQNQMLQICFLVLVMNLYIFCICGMPKSRLTMLLVVRRLDMFPWRSSVREHHRVFCFFLISPRVVLTGAVWVHLHTILYHIISNNDILYIYTHIYIYSHYIYIHIIYIYSHYIYIFTLYAIVNEYYIHIV